MDSIGIHDLRDGGLAFDLIDLLDALGPAAASAWWRARTPVWYLAAGDKVLPALQPSGAGGMWTRGSDLLKLRGQLHQVIDGVIDGVCSLQPPTDDHIARWVVLRAVDSSWWEVYTDDRDVLSKLRSVFRDVRPAHYTPEHPATNY